MASVTQFKGKLLCKEHRLLTCLTCLHSINSGESGYIPHPRNDQWISCPDSAHSVEPLFEKFRGIERLYGFHDGLSPADQIRLADRPLPQVHNIDSWTFCSDCKLTYLYIGAQTKIHPSHFSSNGERCIRVSIHPISFERFSDRVECTSIFHFGPNSGMDSAYDYATKIDFGGRDWNLVNVDIASLTQCLAHVENKLIPYQKQLIKNDLYTNSQYFAGKAWRFQLVVLTPLDPDALASLLRAHKLKYSKKRQAFVERNALGIVTKKYRSSEERRYQTVMFIQSVKRLAQLGIQVYFQSVPQDEQYKTAVDYLENRRPSMPKPSREASYESLNVEGLGISQNEPEGTEDLLDGDSLIDLQDHDGYQAVERESPEVDQSEWDAYQ